MKREQHNLAFTPLKEVSRIELIDQEGRVFSIYTSRETVLSVQDEGRTLKVFYIDTEKEQQK